MEELRKINRVIEREYPEAHLETLVVLDGTTGQNALVQARQFKEAADITGIIITKLDGTAKGGIAIAIESELGVPVKFIGVEHRQQLWSYMRITHTRYDMLVNFGSKSLYSEWYELTGTGEIEQVKLL